MRAYRKTSIYYAHDVVLYFKADEVAALIEEAQGVDPDFTPIWAKVRDRLAATVNAPQEGDK